MSPADLKGGSMGIFGWIVVAVGVLAAIYILFPFMK